MRVMRPEVSAVFPSGFGVAPGDLRQCFFKSFVGVEQCGFQFAVDMGSTHRRQGARVSFEIVPRSRKTYTDVITFKCDENIVAEMEKSNCRE